jgi:hypothetical protein
MHLNDEGAREPAERLPDQPTSRESKEEMGPRQLGGRRFLVGKTFYGWSMKLTGEDPESRYRPTVGQFYERVRQRLVLGWTGHLWHYRDFWSKEQSSCKVGVPDQGDKANPD